MKEIVIVTVLMIGFVLIAKEYREPAPVKLIFTDEEIEAWKPFN